jgi:fatty acid-binding protein DegV
VAKIAGMLSIRLVGKASDEGTLQPTGKARGDQKVPGELLKQLLSMGYKGGRVRIHHCYNLPSAQRLKDAILEKFPQASIIIQKTNALCSFYAEKGGMLVGFET